MATTKKSPLAQMKDKFQDKETLVERVVSVLPSGGDDVEALKKKLLAASNKKLLRLFEIGSEIKTKYGSTDALAAAAAAAVGKAKDQAYVAKLAGLAKKSPGRVLDMVSVATKRAKASA